LFSSAPALYAATYYVDGTSGQDTNPGLSEVTAWKTITKVNASRFSPGDQILFKRGCVWREQLTVPSSGSAGNPIIFGAYGTGNKPVISGANAGAPASPVRNYCVFLQRNYAIIDGLELDYPANSDILLSDADYNIVRNCTVKHAPNFGWKAGIVLNHANHNLISGNTVQDCYHGIVLSSYHAAQSDRNTDANTISRNTITRIDGTGISVASGSTTSYQLKGNIIEYNDVSLCSQTFDDTGGIVTSRAGTGNVIRYNKSYNNGRDPSTMRGTGIMIDENSNGEQVYYNIVYGNTSSGISTSGDDTLIYNNVMYNNALGIFLFCSGITRDSSANSRIKNNIIVANGSQSYAKVRSQAVASGGNVFDYNIYFGSAKERPFSWDSGGPPADDHTWAQWQVHNPEAHSLVSDPLLVNATGGDFRLQSTSPAIDAGTSVALEQDYEGKLITGNPDIGAIERPTGR
jgi:hypothetical protein